MTRRDGRVFYTEEDKNNIRVKEYSKLELRQIRKISRKKSNMRRLLVALLLFILVICSYKIEPLQFVIYIAIIFMIFVAILFEIIDRINKKALFRKYYFEIQVDKKLPTETYVEGTLTPGSDLSTFYPIEGHDTTSKYSSIFYVDEKQYRDADIGTKIKISTKGGHL